MTRTASQRSWLYYKDPMLNIKESLVDVKPRELITTSMAGVGEKDGAR
jgi:hypothetical protein